MNSFDNAASDGTATPPEQTSATSGSHSKDSAGTECFVVGIGASAGGLEALEKVFARMPEQTGMAYVIVQHLSPDFHSHMDELLARKTKIPIHRVKDGMVVEPDSIYLIPPKKDMIISQGRLLLTDKDPERGLTMPIDSFLRSLAQDVGPKSVAVILSGTGSDGSRGVKEVYEAGGLVISQDEDSARFDGMPNAAVQTGVVDLILLPEAIPDALRNHATVGSSQLRAKVEHSPVLEEGMDQIFGLLRGSYGIDFSHYKPSTVVRRTQRRSTMNKSSSVESYAEFVEENPQELDALYRDLLIGVTTFFRDSEAFERLAEEVVTPIVANSGRDTEIRVWVPGCATGEEAYTLAMLFHEKMDEFNRTPNVKIFATDVHRECLEFASAGAYSAEQLGRTSEARTQRYFIERGNKYHIVPELRRMLVFAPHNVISDAPFTKLDLVSCRNLMIYFQPVTQKKVLSLFHFSLRTGGYLFLGPSESLGDIREEFDPVDDHWKLFRKRRDARLPANMRIQLSPTTTGARFREPTRWESRSQDNSLIDYYDLLLARNMPPGYLIDESYRLMHTFGGAEKYLGVKGGRSPSNFLEMLDGELKTAITGGLQHVRKAEAPVSYTGIMAISGDSQEQLKITIEPINPLSEKPGAFMVTLGAVPILEDSDASNSQFDLGEMTREQIGSLESELRFTKENLQATIEELETSNEELQATNEELLASNEELQSTNEELQSVNEELYTVNAEHQRKISELSEMTDDMHNLLESTDVGVIYLDQDLCIRRFTPRVAESFSLLPQDIGRRLDTFAHTIDDPDLQQEVRNVLETGEEVEKQVQDVNRVPYFLRILPYQTGTRTAGVVLTLIEISKLFEAEEARRKVEEELRQSEARKKAILDSALDAIVTMDHEGRIIEFNKAAERLFGYETSEVLGQPVAEKIIPFSFREQQATAFQKYQKDGIKSVINSRTVWTAMRKDGSEFPCELTVTVIETDAEPMFTGFIRDITKRQRAERALKERELQYRGTFDNAAVGMAHKALDGSWLTVNDRFCEITGYTREELLGRKFQELTHTEDLPRNLDNFEKLKSGELKSYQMEKRFIHKDGQHIWVALTVSLQKTKEDDEGYCIAVIQDISKRKQFEQELQMAIDARESFLAMISHELRNPLSAVLNATRLLKRGAVGSLGFSTEDVTSVIERQSNQMAKLLEDLLDVSRISNGKIELDLQPVDLRKLIDPVRETIGPSVRQHETRLITKVPDEPVWVSGDTVRLQQIQINLLGNAIKYSPVGSQVWYTIEADDTHAVIRVKDEGAGIPKSLLEKIFEPFVQTDDTLDRSEGGLGVGLTLVSSLAKMHGGTVTANSDGHGQGSEFVVRLPRLAEPKESQTPSPTEMSQTSATPLNIVIVEDQPDNARLLKAHLELDGHRVRVAYDGNSGLEIILAVEPDVAIMDIGIPGLSGYELADQLRETKSHEELFLIALTGYGQPADVEKATQAGFDAHLVKPLDIHQLHQLLHHRTHAERG